MAGDWQDCVALGIVLASLVYLTRGLWHRPARRSSATVAGCGSGTCAGCPVRSAAIGPNLNRVFWPEGTRPGNHHSL